MPSADIGGLRIAFEVIGKGRPWVITPGGRFSKDAPGVRELAEELARSGQQVVIWDRPNTGASDVHFSGASESEMQADALAGLLEHLGLGPTVVIGGSGGARVSLIAAVRHAHLVAGLGLLWISGGVYGLMQLAVVYGGESIRAAWTGGMEAVVELPEWQEVLERNPRNRAIFLARDPGRFIELMERWMLVYCPDPASTVPGLLDTEVAALNMPAIVFRSGASDPHHTRSTSEKLAGLLAGGRLVEPPWGDREWVERLAASRQGTGGLFQRWPLLALQLVEFARALPGPPRTDRQR